MVRSCFRGGSVLLLLFASILVAQPSLAAQYVRSPVRGRLLVRQAFPKSCGVACGRMMLHTYGKGAPGEGVIAPHVGFVPYSGTGTRLDHLARGLRQQFGLDVRFSGGHDWVSLAEAVQGDKAAVVCLRNLGGGQDLYHAVVVDGATWRGHAAVDYAIRDPAGRSYTMDAVEFNQRFNGDAVTCHLSPPDAVGASRQARPAQTATPAVPRTQQSGQQRGGGVTVMINGQRVDHLAQTVTTTDPNSGRTVSVTISLGPITVQTR